VTCDAKWKSLATKVEREVAAHDTNDLGSDARRVPHEACSMGAAEPVWPTFNRCLGSQGPRYSNRLD